MHKCIHFVSRSQSLLTNGRGGHDSVDDDADTVGPEVEGHRRASRKDIDVGVRHVLKDDLLGLLDGLSHYLWP